MAEKTQVKEANPPKNLFVPTLYKTWMVGMRNIHIMNFISDESHKRKILTRTSWCVKDDFRMTSG